MTAAGGTISIIVGSVVLRLTLTDTYRRYVKGGLGVWLAIAAIAIIVIGIVTLVRAIRSHNYERDHEHSVGVGWLLLAPIAALLLVAPPPLGAYGVDRAAKVNVRPGKTIFEPLARSAEPRQMTLLEYVQRSFDHNGKSFHGSRVQLTGFVAGANGEGFKLARYQIACCAADATPVVVDVVGTSGSPPRNDQWVTVTGTFTQADGEIPRIAATGVSEIPAPDDPYE